MTADRPGMGDRVLGCTLVRPAGTCEVVGGTSERAAVAAHDRLFPAARHHNTWYDEESRIAFSAAQVRGGPSGKDYNFLTERTDFLDGRWGRSFVWESLQGSDELRSLPLVATEELIHALPARFPSPAGRRVMLVLGGPSTRRVNWEHHPTDDRWSVNQYYRSPRLASIQPAVVALAPDVPLGENHLLHQRLETDEETFVLFETERGGPVGSWGPVIEFVRRYPGRCGVFHTRYQSALGIGCRFFVLALLLGATEVAAVGLDGLTEVGPRHTFEPYKGNPPWYRKFGPPLQRRQYVIFWEYVFDLRAQLGVDVANLGERTGVNQSAEMTQRYA